MLFIQLSHLDYMLILTHLAEDCPHGFSREAVFQSIMDCFLLLFKGHIRLSSFLSSQLRSARVSPTNVLQLKRSFLFKFFLHQKLE